MAATASIAMSVKDNLSAALVGMRNSVTGLKGDAAELQSALNQLNTMKVSLKMDADKAAQSVREARKAFLDLTEAERETEEGLKKKEAWEQAEANLSNLREQYALVSRQVRETTKDFEEVSGAIVRANNRADASEGPGGGTEEQISALSALGRAGVLSMAGGVAGEIGRAHV